LLRDAVLPVRELGTCGVCRASALSLLGARHAVSALSATRPAHAEAYVIRRPILARNLDVTRPSEAACVPLQVLRDK
jgi:hypothetical protein